MRKIGILTGGGDAPGLNAVIRAAVLTARREAGVDVIGIRDGFGGFAEGDEGWTPLDEASVRGLIWLGGSVLGCNNRYRGDPGFFCERMRELGLDGLLVAGGNGSLTMAQQMVDLGAAVVGVPKTIDNDVEGTDLTFGFDTAVTVVADACSRLICTAESHHRVRVVEVMGRHTGHIALHGALAGSADVALIPEIPYTPERIVDLINERLERGRTYTVIVAAEGAVRAGGGRVVDESSTARAGREVLGGLADQVAAELCALTDHEARAMSLAHLQRGGAPTVFDRLLATRMAVEATRALLRGESGTFSAYRNSRIEMVPIAAAAGKTRCVEPKGQLVSAARALGLSFGEARE